MTHLLPFTASLFPFNPAADSAMGHRHLMIAYFITWGVHLAYLSYLGLKWKSLRRNDRPL